MALDKLKFFLFRFIPHFILFFIPFWIDYLHITSKLKILVLAFIYLCFHFFHWFLMGKEVNYRLKIYTRSNSSMDRILERVILGLCIMLLVTNVLSLLSFTIEKVIFLSAWFLWVLWISWPTSHKLLERKISKDFIELKFLDGLERICLIVVIIYLFASYPIFPDFNGSDSVKLFFDSRDRFHDLHWNFFDLSFLKWLAPKVNLSLFYYVFVYFLMMFFTLSAHYGVLRFFFSRSLSLLGTVCFIASWSVSLRLNSNINAVYISTQYLVFTWTLLWAIHSSSYRSGFFMGFSLFFSSLINPSMVIPLLPALAFSVHSLSRVKSRWYMLQFLKYASVGLSLSLLSLLIYHGEFLPRFSDNWGFIQGHIEKEFSRKSVYLLALFGALILIYECFKFFKYQSKLDKNYFYERISVNIYVFILILNLVVASVSDIHAFSYFSLISVISFLSIKPLKLIFSKLHEYKSKRNLIFGVYLVLSLLDSRLEERVKILLENF